MLKVDNYNTRAQRAFMELVRCGATGATPDHHLFISLSANDWEYIFTTARRQTVCGICYCAFCLLPDSLLPPDTVLLRWVARVSAIEDSNRRMAEAVPQIVRMMRGIDLHPVVQKGLSVARFYPHPELRECGDIDLWVPACDFSACLSLVRQIDGTMKSHPDGSISFVYQGFVVEIHRKLISISSPLRSMNLEAFALRRCHKHVDYDAPVPSPTPLLELLLISVHIMRHAFGTGIGLRHICDYMCAAYALSGQYDRDEFSEACSLLGISRWVALLNDFLHERFGADPDILPPSGLRKANRIPTEALMSIIMEGGNFGQHSLAAGKKKGSAANGKLQTLSMLLRRSRFAASIAPSEALWNFVRLIIGQMH